MAKRNTRLELEERFQSSSEQERIQRLQKLLQSLQESAQQGNQQLPQGDQP